jgi:hypothetical protein
MRLPWPIGYDHVTTVPTASFHREQARILLRWAHESPDGNTAQRLLGRASEMLALAEQAPDYELRGPSRLQSLSPKGIADELETASILPPDRSPAYPTAFCGTGTLTGSRGGGDGLGTGCGTAGFGIASGISSGREPG